MNYTPIKDAIFYVVQNCTKDFEKAKFRKTRKTPFSDDTAFTVSSEQLGVGMERLEIWQRTPNLYTLQREFFVGLSNSEGKVKPFD